MELVQESAVVQPDESHIISLLETVSSTSDLIYKLTDKTRIFLETHNQLTSIKNLIFDVKVRLNRAEKNGRKDFDYVLNNRLSTLEGVRDMFEHSIQIQLSEVLALEVGLYILTGIRWEDGLEEFRDDYSPDEEDGDDGSSVDSDDSSDRDVDMDRSAISDQSLVSDGGADEEDIADGEDELNTAFISSESDMEVD